MRRPAPQPALFSYRTLEERIPADHPLRAIRVLAEEALRGLGPRLERLLRALLLQILFSVRSERQLMEQLEYNLLFRWFVGLDLYEAVWDVGEGLLRDTHESKTDPAARLYRKSANGALKLSYQAHIVSENGYGMIWLAW